MSLELVLGPMFAGKSSYILSSLRRYEAIGWNILCITSDLDTRYEEGAIHSHNHDRHSAIPTATLMPLLKTNQYKDARLLIIEEAQFFPDLYSFVEMAVDQYGKDVIVVGLDGDSERRPFGKILSLIPLCDKVTKLTAMCKRCEMPTDAIFTYRKNGDKSVVSVGADAEYEALCRTHYTRLVGISNESKQTSLASSADGGGS
jgi:thymidine kinase